MSDTFDVIVIGSGPGGYVCAIRAAQLGMKVACVEKRATLGRHLPQHRLHPVEGAAAIVGGISAKPSHATGRPTASMVDGVRLDLARMQARKAGGGHGEREGRRVPVPQEQGRPGLKGSGRIVASGHASMWTAQPTTTKNIVIASGSDSTSAARRRWWTSGASSAPPAHSNWTSRSAAAFRRSIGGGIIGLELGSVWRRLGAAVTVIEFLDRIAARHRRRDRDRNFQRILQKQGIGFRLGHEGDRCAKRAATTAVNADRWSR